LFKVFSRKKIEKKPKKKMSRCSDAPEDEAISLFAGLLANPDVPLSRWMNWKISFDRTGVTGWVFRMD
jgi:hypothetical protein